jgi:hypothetical protein
LGYWLLKRAHDSGYSERFFLVLINDNVLQLSPLIFIVDKNESIVKENLNYKNKQKKKIRIYKKGIVQIQTERGAALSAYKRK